jgi:hypothetical protein
MDMITTGRTAIDRDMILRLAEQVHNVLSLYVCLRLSPQLSLSLIQSHTLSRSRSLSLPLLLPPPP